MILNVILVHTSTLKIASENQKCCTTLFMRHSGNRKESHSRDQMNHLEMAADTVVHRLTVSCMHVFKTAGV